MKRSVACALAISALVICTATASAQLTEGKPSLAPTHRWLEQLDALGCAVDENAVRGNADAMVPPEWPRWGTPTSTSTTAGWPPARR